MSTQLDEGWVHKLIALDAARMRRLERHEIELLRLFATMSLQSRRQLLAAAQDMTQTREACPAEPGPG